jgi:hypothetical protein
MPEIDFRRETLAGLCPHFDWVKATRYTTTTSLLEQISDMMLQIFVLRGQCSRRAGKLTRRRPVDERALEECARIDDALASGYRALQRVVKQIREDRENRRSRSRGEEPSIQ